MNFWIRNPCEQDVDLAEDLSSAPSGGRVKMWLLGVGLALIPAGYGVHCWRTHQALLFGQNSDLQVTGSAAIALAIAYLAAGLFMHAHWFWGLRPKCGWVSSLLKILALLVFLGSFGCAVYRVIVS